MYRIVSIEDDASEEATLRGQLERYGREHDVDLQLVWMRSAEEFVQGRTACDLIFMDIDLPGMSGLDMASLLRTYDETTPLIFLTNLAQYALRGYEVQAFDFVVKPLTYYGLSIRMDRVIRSLRKSSETNLRVSVSGGIRVIPASDLVYVEVSNHLLTFHVASGRDAQMRGSLSKVEKELEGSPFVVISQSYLANMSHIREVNANDVVMSNGDKLFFSRPKRKQAMAAIAEYLGGSV
jgi:DNA-binding LytR/AlgR family response regulator